ncbi:MAG TPA: glycosyltransferase [Tabrizicola sp.]|nr:glycosyltransferase [Tabrizicola sp.]
MSGSRAIVLGITADFAFAAGALVASLRTHDPDCDAALVILHDGLEETQQQAFRQLWPGCRFQSFASDAAVARLGPGEHVSSFIEEYSPLVLAKLGLPDFLEEFERVIWLDADILARGPLGSLWDFDCLAWRGLPAGAMKRREKALSAFQDLRLNLAVPLLNGGVIGVSRRFVELGGSSEMLHAFARKLAAASTRSQFDELPWYVAAASRNMPVRELPLAFNHPVGSKGAEGAVLVHAIGVHKFWNATPLLQQFPDWTRHQQTWVDCGGRPYDGDVLLGEVHPLDPAEVFRAAQARSYWLAVFRDLWPALPKGMVVDLQHDGPKLRIFLHGRPETEHVKLQRHPNERRIGLELVLPSPLRERVSETICLDVRWSRAEKPGVVSLPFKQLGPALQTVETVVSDAIFRL